MIGPIGTMPAVSPALARPYAALLLEERKGDATFIAASALAPTTTPDDKVLATYLTQNRARYSLPERRVLRYAVFDRSAVPVAPVTDAENRRRLQGKCAALCGERNAPAGSGNRADARRRRQNCRRCARWPVA